MAEQELKVLLIEDNPGDAFLIKFYLGESTSPAFSVSHAETVKSGLDLLALNKFDIILSDMNLPDSFGVDTIKSILGKFPGNLVMVLTGLTDEEVGLETVRYGAQDFLVKGKFDGKVLISSVMFAFERFKLNKQIDNVSKELDQENSRFDSIQRLLNVGYIEYTGKSFYRSDFVSSIFGADTEGTKTIDDIFALTEDPAAFRQLVDDVLEKGGKGEFTFQGKQNGSSYRMSYEKSEGKFCGIIQKTSELNQPSF
jgi:two-component system cell cycle response regulator